MIKLQETEIKKKQMQYKNDVLNIFCDHLKKEQL